MAELFAKLGIDWKLLIANTITFLIVLWVLRKFAYAPLLTMLDKRRQTIDQGLKDAEAAKAERAGAQTEHDRVVQEAHQQALAILQGAHQDAERRRQDLMAKAEADAQRLLSTTTQELARQKQQMIGDAKGELAGLIVQATAKLMDEQLDDKLQRKLTDRALNVVSETHAR